MVVGCRLYSGVGDWWVGEHKVENAHMGRGGRSAAHCCSCSPTTAGYCHRCMPLCFLLLMQRCEMFPTPTQL
jgi:hypothetical protein